MSIISTKRKATEAFIPMDPNQRIVTVKPFPKMPQDILLRISLFLDEKNLFNFERTTKGLQEKSISNEMWKNMKVKSGLDFSWALCAGEIKREKYEYRINKTIYTINKPCKSRYNVLFDDTNEYRFKGLLDELSKRLPPLKTFIDARFANEKYWLREEKEVANLPYEAGEWMLKGFMLAKCSAHRTIPYIMLNKEMTDPKSVADCFRQAIAENATIVNKFAARVFEERALQLEFAVQSALLGDERALWDIARSILSKYSRDKDLINKNETLSPLSPFYSVLLYLAARSAEIVSESGDDGDTLETCTLDVSKQQAALALIEKALPLLRNQKVQIMDQGFAVMLLRIADFLSSKNRLAEAEEFYRFALRASTEIFPPEALIRVAKNKSALKKDSEAEAFCERAMRASIPARVFFETAMTKLSLGKNEEAEELYDYGMEKLNSEKKKSNESKTFVSESAVLANAAFIKLRIKKHEEAERFSDKAIKAYREKVPLSVLKNAIIIKRALRKYQEAEELSKRIPK